MFFSETILRAETCLLNLCIARYAVRAKYRQASKRGLQQHSLIKKCLSQNG